MLVVGLGRFGGGVGVTRWLAEQGAIVTVTDQAPRESLADSIRAVGDLNVALHLGGHDVADLDCTDWVIVNPAVVKSRSSFFQETVRRNLPWTTEMNLFCERCPAPVIGVTGTYGKSTTCAMLAHVLSAWRDAGKAPFHNVHFGGNIGVSLLNELSTIKPHDVVILEMSNAQLEDLPRIEWRPTVAVITNIWPHHLDRHESFCAYAKVKFNIVGDVNRTPCVIVGDLHPEVGPLPDDSTNRRRSTACVIRVTPPDDDIRLCVPGRHNRMNAAIVLTVTQQLGLDEALVQEALSTFRGLPHRLEFIRTLDGVDFVNDSKSTSPSAAIVALDCFDRPIVAIVGGQRKDVPLGDFSAAARKKCQAVICTGESAREFAASLTTHSDAHAPRVLTTDGLDDAISRARALAKPGDVVLFTPGAPSFDGYANFTERGDHFTRLVRAL